SKKYETSIRRNASECINDGYFNGLLEKLRLLLNNERIASGEQWRCRGRLEKALHGRVESSS
ncbi:hypothetical protein, partial [Caballeronia telluris]|uniref:hypothetical protein n=1 Tax=Caballeronia telluris TaxID=326475 RepID=UPI001F18E357